jgi:hypothetical protein
VFSRFVVINEGSTVCQLRETPRFLFLFSNRHHLSHTNRGGSGGAPLTRKHARDGGASRRVRGIDVRAARQEGARVVFVSACHSVQELRVDG